MTAAILKQHLYDLETYAIKCVERGGINTSSDPEWIARTRHLAKLHNRWAAANDLPELAELPDNNRDLIPWMQALQLNGTTPIRLGAILCHIDVARSLEYWADAVTDPLDPIWPQDLGWRFVPVPAGAWQQVLGETANESWVLEPLVVLRNLWTVESPGIARATLLSADEALTVRQAPAFVTLTWLQHTFRWHAKREELEERIQVAKAEDACAAAELAEWDRKNL